MLIHPHIISVHKTRVTLALRITSNPAKKYLGSTQSTFHLRTCHMSGSRIENHRCHYCSKASLLILFFWINNILAWDIKISIAVPSHCPCFHAAGSIPTDIDQPAVLSNNQSCWAIQINILAFYNTCCWHP